MRNYYKYYFKVGNKIVHGGITNDLERRQSEHRNSSKYETKNGNRYYWSNGHIFKVGQAVSKEAALKWERENGFGPDQHN